MKLAVLFALSAASSTALAAANCPKYPKNEWMSQDQAKTKIESMGYKIDKFKIDGNCYEIYGSNKDGKKVEIYFDTKSLDVVKAEVKG